MSESDELVSFVDEIDAKSISDLANKRFLALRIADFCERIVCDRVMENLSGMQGQGYKVNPNFRKIVGGALFDAADDPSALSSYLDSTPAWYRESRRVFSPYASPADRVRLHLEEIWPAGCSAIKIGGKTAFAGLLRGIGLGAGAEPHQDMTNWDLPDSGEALALETQLSCLTYFACAEIGGELELWRKEIESREEYEQHLNHDVYGLDRSYIGPPDVVITPRIGELIIFNARCIHAVRKIEAGSRYSQSFFIGYQSDTKALSVFS